MYCIVQTKNSQGQQGHVKKSKKILFVVSVVCCQKEISATGRSVVQKIPSGCVSVYDLET
jgi:hypothetical protein